MDKEQIWIKQNHITEYLYTALIRIGYVPTTDELLDLSDIVLCYLTQFLIDKNIIDEVEFLDEEEEMEDDK